MNDRRRMRLREAIKLINKAADIVSDVSDEEGDSLDNMPENLQDSEKYDRMENNVDALDLIEESLLDINERIEDVIEGRE